MKLLYVTTSMEVGGVETNLVGLCGELRRRGHEVWVASSGGVLEGELATAGARHVRLPLSLHRPLSLIGSAWSIRQLVEREQFEVVHAMSAAGNLAATLAPRSGRFFSSPMGLQNSDREAAWVTFLRTWLMTLRTDCLLAISPEIERALRGAGVPAGKMLRCSVNAIDCARLQAADGAAVRRELGIGPDQPLVTTIGALHPRKSHHLFVAAAARLLEKCPEARFLVVGEGPLRSELEAQAAALRLAGRLTFTGERRDVPDLLAATTVYIKPGVVEGFIGITVLEAQAAGTPVVAFRTRDVEEAIVPGQTGLLVPPGDVDALAEAVAGLLARPADAADMAARGQALATERFGLDAVVSGLEAAYAGPTAAAGVSLCAG